LLASNNEISTVSIWDRTMTAELTLDEMLADPIVHLVMERHGVADIEVRQLIRRLKAAYPQIMARRKTIGSDSPHASRLAAA
jgi:hypothetical protein